MILPIFQIDSFTSSLFHGNPAAVCPLKEWLPDETMLHIAQENNLSETAFFVRVHANTFSLKWFTPEIEMDLCGHATLAAAYVISKCMDYDFSEIIFQSASGDLKVKVDDDFIEMDFPSRPPVQKELPDEIAAALSVQPKEVYKARDYMLVYDSEETVKNLVVDQNKLMHINLDPGGIIVTASGTRSDFVSRFFTPGAAIFEDPVTGSAHCTLTPFWAERLEKPSLHAVQLSKRGGTLQCRLAGDRVFIGGYATKYMEGRIFL